MTLRIALRMISTLYLTALGTWWVAILLFGDRWWWLFILNTFASYLFLPLPVTALTAYTTRSRPLLVGSAAATLMGLWLYGPLFLPRRTVPRAAGPALTVMTSNLLAFQDDTAATIAALRAAGADVIALQEVNGDMATALKQEFAEIYPYQLFSVGDGPMGMAVISRYPLRDTDKHFSGDWIGTPQIVEVELGSSPVYLINIHNVSIRPRSPSLPAEIERSSRLREAAARVVVAYTEQFAGPIIVLGDFNTPELSTTYHILNRHLQDAWRVAGHGLGHTFPGSDLPGSSRPTIAGFYVPQWLTRIDYIFASKHWHIEDAWIGLWDGRSDHRPVMAKLSLR